MKQIKTQEVRLTRADMIAYIAERDRQHKSDSTRKAAAKKTRNNAEAMAGCMPY